MEADGRILVVDNEPGMREGCRWVLSAEGYEVDLAKDGLEGLDKLRDGGFAIALSDLKMPGMDGLDLVRAAQEAASDTVCIVITGYATLETAVEATKRGAYDFISKPFTPDELTCSVRRALERRRLSLEARRLREEMERNLLHLNTEKSRLRSIINCMQDGVLVTNREAQLVLTNPAALRMLRLQEADVLGGHVTRIGLGRELSELIAWPLSDGGFVMRTREFEAGDRALMANVAPIRDERSEVLGSVAVIHDITRLKELDKVKSQFVRMVAHELRAPLGAISQYLDVLNSGAVANDPERQSRMLNRCQDRATALLSLIDDLLDLSKIEAGRVARDLEPLQLGVLLAETIDVFRAQAEARDIAIKLEAELDLPLVLGDRRDLSRVFTNLLSNAIKYNRNGGKVIVRAQRDDGRVRVAFEDTGYGIPPESLSHLGEEFYRVKMVATERVTGTGLGLAIVKRLLEAHNGYLTIASEVGVGSTFTVFLPVHAPVGSPPG